MFTIFRLSLFSLLFSTLVFTEASSMTMQELNKLTDPDGATDDIFGHSVAISGNTVIVGAPGHNSYAGVAYIYEYQSETNTFVKKASLSNSHNVANSFGRSVAISGDTVIVGADDENCTGGEYCGAAYLFEKPASGGWIDTTESTKLTASDSTEYDWFGNSVAISDDTAIVGVGGDSDSAYLFEKPTSGGWVNATENVKLTAPEGTEYNLFGYRVAISGNTAIVGAIGSDSSPGTVYLFEKPVSGWAAAAENIKLTNSAGVAGGYFGISIAISDDTVIVGADRDDDGGSGFGAAYLFEKPASGGWVDAAESAKLIASDSAKYDRFGKSVAISGNTVIVGASRVDNDSGSAYLFEKHPAEGWTSAIESKLTASDSAAGDNFGYSVALSGDTAIVGARGYNSDSGSAYIFKSKASQGAIPALIMYLFD